MKYLLLLSLLFIACNEVTYKLHTIYNVPDSLKDNEAQFVIETVRAASYHMTGGDYEDPEDVIYQAQRTFENIYAIPILCLIKGSAGEWTTVLPSQFSPYEKRIFDSLKSDK